MNIQKVLIIFGIIIILIGLFWPVLSKLPLGRLPGDITIDRPGVKIYIPITTMIILSLILSVIAWFWRR